VQATRSLAEGLPEAARDLRLNLAAVLGDNTVEPRVRFGVAYAAALARGSGAMARALRRDAAGALDEATVDDARAAAALMAMNNVYYRFRHMVGKGSYGTLPAGLRMNRIAKPATDQATFELLCLAISALNGCELCIRSHEASLMKLGTTEAAVHDAVRVAAVVGAVCDVLATEAELARGAA
jgi:alkyl hydroperoxide reductase subunit D